MTSSTEEKLQLCNMAKDISYRRPDYGFSYRVAGVVIENGKALLQCFNGEYAFIGGQVAENERAAEALKREFYEEIHTEIEVCEMCAVGETFFTWDNIPYQQIGLYFKVSLPENVSIPRDGSFKGFDEYENKRVDLDFCWIPLNELSDIPLYPKELIPHIISDSDKILHFISND